MRNAAVLAILTLAAASGAPPQPTFFARQDYPSFGPAAIGDLNGDGFPDIVVNGEEFDITTFLNNGDGTFRKVSETDIGDVCFGPLIAVTDVNGDHYADLILPLNGCGGPKGVGVALGNGDGTFQPLAVYSFGDGSDWQVVVRDFNGDGIPDIATASDSGIWFLAGEGSGLFAPAVLTPLSNIGYSEIAAADFNGDTKLDLAITYGQATSTSGFSVFFGNGDGTFQAPTSYPAPNGGTNFLSSGDFNGDGYPDVVITALSSDSAYIYLNNRKGGFRLFSEVVSMSTDSAISVGDVNGDGIADLVNAKGYVAYGRGNGAFKPAVSYTIQSSGPASYYVGPPWPT